MSCDFTTPTVEGLLPAGGLSPNEIVVSGGSNLTDGDKPCEKVEVVLTIEGVAMQDEAPVDETTGDWSITFVAGVHYTAGSVSCDRPYKVDVHCLPAGPCPDSTFGGDMSCRPRDCPDATLVLVDQAGNTVSTGAGAPCVPAGFYHAELTEPTGTGNIYSWTIAGASFSSAPTNQPNSPPFEVVADGGAVAVGVTAQVLAIPGCVVSDLISIDACLEPSGSCPDSLDIVIIDAAGVPVTVTDSAGASVPAGTEGTCVPAGTYRGRVAPIGSDDIYNWNINTSFEPGPDDEAVSPPFTIAAGESVALSATVVSLELACVPDVDPVLLEACEGDPVDCSRATSITVEVDLPPGVASGDCLSPGQHVARATVTDDAGTEVTGLDFDWSRDGDPVDSSLDPTNFPVGGPALLFELAAGESVDLTVATTLGEDCPILSDGESVTACDCPTLDLVVIDDAGDPVDTSDCIEPGKYVAIVRGPAPTGTTFEWEVDGVGQAESGPEISFELLEEEAVTIEVSAELDDDCDFRDRLAVRACTCPDPLTLTVTDPGGNVVTGCVTPGDFVVRVSGDDVSAEDVTWNVDGVTITDAMEVPVTVTGADGFGCAGGVMGPSVSVAVPGEGDCPERVAGTTLDICQSSRFNPCCWIWRMLVLVAATVAMIGLALALCPQVVFNPLIPQSASWVPIAAVAGWIIFGVAAVIAVVLGVIWYFLCNPTWCNDWLVLLWQFMVSAGFVFVYFGACPTCGLLGLGIAMMLIGAGLFVIWVGRCRPTLCRIFFEIGTLGLVQVLVGWLEFVLVVCIWTWGWLLQLLWVTLLNFVGWIGLIFSCQVNPNA